MRLRSYEGSKIYDTGWVDLIKEKRADDKLDDFRETKETKVIHEPCCKYYLKGTVI